MFKKHLVSTLVIGAAVLLVGCVPARMVKIDDRKTPNLATEGILVFQANRAGEEVAEKDIGKFDDVYIVFREEGTQNWFLRSSDKGKPRATHIKAGRYYIQEIWADDLYLQMPAFPDGLYDPASDFKLQPFTLKAGEALYLGDLEIGGVGASGRYSSTGRYGRSDKDVSIVVVDDFADAEDALKERYPEYSDPLKKSLLVPSN